MTAPDRDWLWLGRACDLFGIWGGLLALLVSAGAAHEGWERGHLDPLLVTTFAIGAAGMVALIAGCAVSLISSFRRKPHP